MSTARLDTASDMVRVSADAARAMIARAILGSAPAPMRLGDVELAPHQREAVARLRREIARTGGALLADAVGLGKTYVALALASEAERPLVVAPAALRAMWHGALTRTSVKARFISVQQLSRGLPELEEPDLVIVDEAHHFRNPATLRYASLGWLTRRAHVLLLTATPVHNTRRDLDALLALFVGASAASLDDAERARSIIRRESAAAWTDETPQVEPTRWLELTHRDELLDALAALPAPVPPIDGADAGALLGFSLLRQWASSEGALIAALRRRAARAVALIAAMEDGRHPSKAELATWRFAEDAVQLAFPGLVAGDATIPLQALLEQARAHEAAVCALLRRLAGSTVADAERANRLRAVRAAHPGERIVVFSQFADTIDAMWRELHGDAAVCALAGRGARVAGGPISREEALARFAPRAAAGREPSVAERIDLLLTTDLLSEGVNLQDASVLVHLDLPWTPARIEQRVGRLARPGAARDRVAVYAFAPPARVEAVLAVEARLREKLRAASRAAGVSGVILPSLLGSTATGEASPSQHAERLRSVLHSWLREDVHASSGDGPAVVACIAAERPGFIALLSGASEGGPRLVASLGDGVMEDRRVIAAAMLGEVVTDDPRVIAETTLHDGVTDDPRLIAEAVGLADVGDCSDDPGVRSAGDRDRDSHIRACVARVTEWLADRRGTASVALPLVAGERARKAVLRRVGSILSRAPRHDRSRLAPLAHDARQSALLPLGSGAERVLRELATATLPDEAWLRAVAAFGGAHGLASQPGRGDGSIQAERLEVLIILET